MGIGGGRCPSVDVITVHQGLVYLRSSPSDTAPACASLLVPSTFPQCTRPPLLSLHLSRGDVTQSTSSEQKQEWPVIQTEEDPPTQWEVGLGGC